ncbi:MAG TPA: hypothetical protein VLM40_00870 [Gemmata sp.]|nr:hypothetical protein [Gemmata sp.]
MTILLLRSAADESILASRDACDVRVAPHEIARRAMTRSILVLELGKFN